MPEGRRQFIPRDEGDTQMTEAEIDVAKSGSKTKKILRTTIAVGGALLAAENAVASQAPEPSPLEQTEKSSQNQNENPLPHDKINPKQYNGIRKSQEEYVLIYHDKSKKSYYEVADAKDIEKTFKDPILKKLLLEANSAAEKELKTWGAYMDSKEGSDQTELRAAAQAASEMDKKMAELKKYFNETFKKQAKDWEVNNFRDLHYNKLGADRNGRIWGSDWGGKKRVTETTIPDLLQK